MHFNFTVDSKGLGFIVNGVQYKSPKLPSLLKVLSGASKAGDFDPTENAVIIKPGSIVEINITGFADHPFHLQCVLPPASYPRFIHHSHK
jgi:iron transport multicopper oxidase